LDVGRQRAVRWVPIVRIYVRGGARKGRRALPGVWARKGRQMKIKKETKIEVPLVYEGVRCDKCGKEEWPSKDSKSYGWNWPKRSPFLLGEPRSDEYGSVASVSIGGGGIGGWQTIIVGGSSSYDDFKHRCPDCAV
jgi:hypothetical protein